MGQRFYLIQDKGEIIKMAVQFCQRGDNQDGSKVLSCNALSLVTPKKCYE